jgi:hypothetical protein
MKLSELKRRLFVATFLTAAVSAFAPSIAADDVRIDYTEYSLDSDVAKRYWSDALPSAQKIGELDPAVYVGEFKNGDVELTVTMLGAMSICGMSECPVRIYQGDDLRAELSACYNTGTHSVSPSGYFFSACDNVFATRRK